MHKSNILRLLSTKLTTINTTDSFDFVELLELEQYQEHTNNNNKSKQQDEHTKCSQLNYNKLAAGLVGDDELSVVNLFGARTRTSLSNRLTSEQQSEERREESELVLACLASTESVYLCVECNCGRCLFASSLADARPKKKTTTNRRRQQHHHHHHHHCYHHHHHYSRHHRRQQQKKHMRHK